MSADRNCEVDKNISPRKSYKPGWIDTNHETVITTPRSFEQVMNGFLVPDDYLTSPANVLSVGEGLSYFAQTLQEKYPVSVVAVDPIYSAGRGIFSRQPDIVDQILAEKFHGSVLYDPDRHSYGFAGGESELAGNLVAGSVYNLPFRDGVFKLVFGYNVAEHINFARALPELARVLNPEGEIRLKGTFVGVKLPERLLLPFAVGFRGNKNFYGFYYTETLGARKSLAYIAENKGLTGYVVLDGLPKRSEVREEGIYHAGMLIIRKDDKKPQFVPISEEEKVREEWSGTIAYPHLGELYKIGDTGVNSAQFGCRSKFYRVDIVE